MFISNCRTFQKARAMLLVGVALSTLCVPLYAQQEGGSTDSPTASATPELPPAPAPDRNIAANKIANGDFEKIETPVPFYVDRGVTMAPLRPLCDFLGVGISYLDGVLTLRQQDEDNHLRVITLKINSKGAQITNIDGVKKVELRLPVEARLGNTFVPLRFVSETFGAFIGFRASNNALVIKHGTRVGVLNLPLPPEYKGRDAATLTINNHIGKPLSLKLGGPQHFMIELGKGARWQRKVRPGVYYYKAGSAGMKPRSGARRLYPKRPATWSWGRKH